MDDKPKKRGRQPKAAAAAAKETKLEQLAVNDTDLPAEQLQKEPVKGGKRKAPVKEIRAEKPEKKPSTKKAKSVAAVPEASADDENGSHENGQDLLTEQEAPAKKGRPRKNVPVPEEVPVKEVKPSKSKAKKDAEMKEEKTTKTAKAEPAVVLENDMATVEEKPATTARRGKTKPVPAVTTEAEETSNVQPKTVAKGRGKAQSKTETKGKKQQPKLETHEENDDQPDMKEELVLAAAKPNARGRKRAAKVEEPPVASVIDDKVTIENDVTPSVDTSNGVIQRKRGMVFVDKKNNGTDKSTAAPKEKKAKVATASKMNKCTTDYESISFGLEDHQLSNFKISSWNVAGLRSWVEKGGVEFIHHEKPDIICFQETKCTEEQLPEEMRHVPGYHPYWLCNTKGYAGVAIYSKKMPIHVAYGLGDAEHDRDGRLLTAEYEKFYLVCVYVPNSGKKLVNLPARMRWDEKFQQYLRELDAKKPVILCGDMNVAHEEIDLTNPKTNRRNAGFTQEERDGLSKLISYGFVDTFRKLYPDRQSAYTFWTYMGGARAKNVGWRLDYFIMSERLVDKVTDNVIRSQVYGSDHCPVTLFLNF
ncbi:DNA-(apurinic or apyrimidinic site) endonuclease [Anopheles nili]|uniref:DNA-(apurinic or apyrimidinic site) endonuclease n=1 Tax=Anopheles nili TaxID=185578 RepID=UPI00237C2956|nr:DNA-(apurinic or apyrimidinic site) endonuclease [Anopheles nili]